MSTPLFSPAGSSLPDPSLMEDAPEPDYGPDATKTAPRAVPGVGPTVDGELPKSARGRIPKPVADVLGKVGKNKPARSPKGLRRLTEEDRDKLAALYAGVGAGIKAGALMGLPVLKERTGVAFADNAEACADAWMEMAEENVHVRRAILFMVEGGAWTKLFVAHLPILATLMPDTPPKWVQDMLTKRMASQMEQTDEGSI